MVGSSVSIQQKREEKEHGSQASKWCVSLHTHSIGQKEVTRIYQKARVAGKYRTTVCPQKNETDLKSN